MGTKRLLQLTRSEFELLNEDLFESVVDPIEAALADADIGPGDVDEIVAAMELPSQRRKHHVYTRGKKMNMISELPND
uniref:Uncharacterized protein n=1 Tax=Parascaris equorum TaxID=6256 RepID=A0A914R6M0_PAREQ